MARFKRTPSGGWVRELTDGKKYYFGDGVESATEGDFLWRLTSVVDKNGNMVEYRYVEENAYSRISSIHFTGNTAGASPTKVVNFYYEDRSDKIETYKYGTKQIIHKRLQGVTVVNDGVPVRAYTLGYAYSQSSKRSLLKSITKSGYNYTISSGRVVDGSKELIPFSFEYADDAITDDHHVNAQAFRSVEQSSSVFVGDFNGDHYKDIVRTTPYGDGLVFVFNNKNGGWSGEDKHDRSSCRVPYFEAKVRGGLGSSDH